MLRIDQPNRDMQAANILRNSVTRIEAFERTGHPMQMQHHGLHIWPLVKYQLIKQTIFAMGRNFAASDALERNVRALRRNDLAQMNWLQGWLKRVRMHRRTRAFDLVQVLPGLHVLPDEAQEGPVLLFGSASGFQDTPQGRASAHHHALHQALVARGHAVVSFYTGAPAPSDLAASARYGGAVDLDPLIRHVPKLSRMTAYAEDFLTPIFPDLRQVARPTGHRVESLCAYVDILAGQVLAGTQVMTTLLDRLEPRAVFSSNYASLLGWAMAYVCRRSGIACIDIQHGIEGRYNGAYHFASTPSEDWNILPTHHLTWTQEDADFFTAQHPDRRAAVMGTHTGQLARLSNAPAPVGLNAFASQRPVLLFTAQFAEDILVARDLQRQGLNVIFRGHPTQRDTTNALVDAADLEALNCRIGSEMPLTTLIQNCDGLITGYSATILEAAELGKPVFATRAFAELLFEDYATTLDGVLTLDSQQGGPGLADRLRQWSKGLAVANSAIQRPLPDMNAALDALLAGV